MAGLRMMLKAAAKQKAVAKLAHLKQAKAAGRKALVLGAMAKKAVVRAKVHAAKARG